MPCTGPDKNYSDELAKKALIDIRELLRTKYNILVDENSVATCSYFPGVRQSYIDAHKQLDEAVTELFWADHCASW
jgi:hypothetical protein